MTTADGEELHPMHITELRTENALLLGDHVSLSRNLQFVRDCCARIAANVQLPDDERDSVIIEALWTAAVIAYARCFNSGVRAGLTEDDIGALALEGDAVGFHRYVWGLRNKHLAHSVNPFEMAQVGAILTAPDLPGHRVEGVGMTMIRHTSADPVGVAQLHDLALVLIAEVGRRVEQLTAVVQGEAELMDIEDLYAQPEMRYVAPGPQHTAINRRRYHDGGAAAAPAIDT